MLNRDDRVHARKPRGARQAKRAAHFAHHRHRVLVAQQVQERHNPELVPAHREALHRHLVTQRPEHRVRNCARLRPGNRSIRFRGFRNETGNERRTRGASEDRRLHRSEPQTHPNVLAVGSDLNRRHEARERRVRGLDAEGASHLIS